MEKALRLAPNLFLIKSHVKAHERMSASGKLEQVHEYDDSRTGKQKPAKTGRPGGGAHAPGKGTKKEGGPEAKPQARQGYPQRSKASQKASVKAVEGKLPKVLYHGTSAPEFDKFQNGLTYLAPDKTEADAYAHDPIIGGGRGQGRPRVMKITPSPGRVKDISKDADQALMDGEDMDQFFAQEAKKAQKEGFRYLQFHHPSAKGGDNFPVTISMHPQEDLRIEQAPSQNQDHRNEPWYTTKQMLEGYYRRMQDLRENLSRKPGQPDKKAADELVRLRARTEQEERIIRRELKEALEAGKDVPKDVLATYGVVKK